MMREDRHWYVGYVRSCQEKRVAAALQAAGEECYLPLRRERRRWSDRYKTVEVVLLKGMIFIRTTDARRVELMQGIYGLYAFMADKATHRPVVVPDGQMEAFIFMVERSGTPVYVSTGPLAPGDRVRIRCGSMEGLEGELVQIGNRHRLVLRLQHLFCAMVEVVPDDVEKIS
jgi:transcription antitermination factor NusG